MKKLFRKVFIYLPLCSILIVGLVYFIVTSGFFLKFVGLPLTGALIGMPIKVEGINVSLLINPHLDVSGLTFGYPEKPFVTGKKISTRFDLLSLLKGDLKLINVSVDGVDINMASGKDGKWNVYWMNEASSSGASKVTRREDTKPASSPAMQLDISGLSIRNVNFTLNSSDDIKVALKNFSIYSDSFKNRQESSVKINGSIEQFAGNNVAVNNGKVDVLLKTNLNEEYFPTFLHLDSVISDFTGIIKDKTLSNRSFKINALLNPEGKNAVNVSDISIKECAGDTIYSSLVTKGKVTLTPFAFDLNINVDPVGSDTINLATNSFLHTDMGNDASLIFKGDVSLANNLLAVKGDLKLADLLLQSPVSSTRKELVSAAFKYNISTDFFAKKTDIEQLHIAVDRDGAAMINMSLKKPASITWENDQIKVTGEDPEIVAKISDLKLGVFNDFLPAGAELSSGVLNSNLNLKVGANGADISMFGNVNLSDASYISSDFNIKGVSLNQAVNLTLGSMRHLTLKKCSITLSQNGQKLLESSFNGKYDMDSGNGELKTSIPYYSTAIVNVLPDSMLSKQEKKQTISKISQFNFTINNSQGFSIKGKTITVKDFLLELQTEKKEIISFMLDKSLKLDLNGEKLIPEDLLLKVKAANFELSKLNGVLPINTKIENGKVDMDAILNAENMFEKISASGALNIARAGIKINGNPIPAADIGAKFGTTLEKKLLNINVFNVLIQTERGEKLSAGLSKPAGIDFKNSRALFGEIAVNASVESLDLKSLNGFLDPGTKFQKGTLSLKADAMVEKDFNKISASGSVMAADISGNVNGNILNKTGINTNFNVVYNEAGAFTLTDTVVKVLYGNKDAANISVNGTLSNDGATNFETQFKVNEYLLKALNKTGSDYEKVGEFLLDGSLKLKTVKDAFSVDGNINIPKLVIVNKQQALQPEQINGALDLSVYKNSQYLNINSARLNLYSNRSNICDLAGSGKILFSGGAQSTLDVSSEKIDLEKLVHVYGLLFPAAQESSKTKNKTAAQTQAKEPAPIDLSGINLKGNINFKDIQYGPFIHTVINSNLTIKSNTVALQPLTIKMNQGELSANVYLNPSFADGYTYEIKSQLKNIDVNPLLKTFIEGDYGDAKGTISSLQFNAKGKGVTNPRLLNNLNGNMIAKCDNFSLPLDISKNKFLALFLMPIQMISNIGQKLPNTPLPSDLNQAMNLAVKIMDQHKNINFQTGDIALKMSGGVINVEKFYFVGGDDDMIKTMKFGGTIGPDNKLNLKTNTNFGKLDIPLNFYGTVENPKFDIPAFIAGFITKNTINILDVTQELLNNASAPQQQQGSEEPVQQLGNALFDVAKGILGNLTDK